MQKTLTIVGAVLLLAGILSFLVPTAKVLTVLLLGLGAAGVILGAWFLDA